MTHRSTWKQNSHGPSVEYNREMGRKVKVEAGKEEV